MRAFCLLALALLVSQPAYAAETATKENEIVYRTNLGRAEDIRLLLEQGANANQTDEKGTPLLCLAANRTDAEAVKAAKTLLDAGADIDGKDRKGQNALFYAARKGNGDVVQLLLERKINYYAVDNNGDIARTIAFREGHTEILSQMDNFVKGETAKVSEQYRDLEKNLAAQYKSQEESTQQSNADATREALDKHYKQNTEQAKQQEELDAETQAITDKRNSKEFLKDRYNLLFHACGFEYWSFCDNMNQTSDLKDEQLANAILSHKNEVLTTSDSMMSEYALRRKYLDHYINLSKKSTYAELNGMPSKTYRFEHGVCKMQDMIKRCEDIAENGGSYSSKYAPPPATKSQSSNNAGGHITAGDQSLEKASKGKKHKH